MKIFKKTKFTTVVKRKYEIAVDVWFKKTSLVDFENLVTFICFDVLEGNDPQKRKTHIRMLDDDMTDYDMMRQLEATENFGNRKKNNNNNNNNKLIVVFKIPGISFATLHVDDTGDIYLYVAMEKRLPIAKVSLLSDRLLHFFFQIVFGTSSSEDMPLFFREWRDVDGENDDDDDAQENDDVDLSHYFLESSMTSATNDFLLFKIPMRNDDIISQIPKRMHANNAPFDTEMKLRFHTFVNENMDAKNVDAKKLESVDDLFRMWDMVHQALDINILVLKMGSPAFLVPRSACTAYDFFAKKTYIIFYHTKDDKIYHYQSKAGNDCVVNKLLAVFLSDKRGVVCRPSFDHHLPNNNHHLPNNHHHFANLITETKNLKDVKIEKICTDYDNHPFGLIVKTSVTSVSYKLTTSLVFIGLKEIDLLEEYDDHDDDDDDDDEQQKIWFPHDLFPNLMGGALPLPNMLLHSMKEYVKICFTVENDDIDDDEFGKNDDKNNSPKITPFKKTVLWRQLQEQVKMLCKPNTFFKYCEMLEKEECLYQKFKSHVRKLSNDMIGNDETNVEKRIKTNHVGFAENMKAYEPVTFSSPNSSILLFPERNILFQDISNKELFWERLHKGGGDDYFKVRLDASREMLKTISTLD